MLIRRRPCSSFPHVVSPRRFVRRFDDQHAGRRGEGRAPRPAFPERLTTYLEAEFPFVEPRAKLTGASGSPYQVTAAVGSSEKWPVYVQTASGQNTAAQRSAVERCFTMFSDVRSTSFLGEDLPTERKLVVLDDEATPQWRPEMIYLLAGVAYVGTWTARDQWTEFVWGNCGNVPESRLMLPPEQPTRG
ncbi:MAG: hypothetical protein ACRDTJ_20525 [Pseudonocardiaceae bacterium]